MRFRLLKRRLTISAPTMSIRSRAAWPLRWVLLALTLGFSAAIALWAFETGKGLAGLDRDQRIQLAQLQEEAARLRAERDAAQSDANTKGGLLATEKATSEQLAKTLKALEGENRNLRDDLSFFERLIPSNGGHAPLAIRGLQAQMQAEGAEGAQLLWQVLIVQSTKNSSEFKGRLQLTASGMLNGRPWSASLPDGGVRFEMKQYRRLQGLLPIPQGVQVKAVTVKLLDNGDAHSSASSVKATQSIKL